MSDVTFVVKGVPQSSVAVAQRKAVLRQVSGCRLHLGDAAAADAALGAAVKKWRRRLVQLREAGWAPATGKSYQYMRNCPPCGVEVALVGRDSVKPCGKDHVCPWCWARERVGATFARVWEVLVATGNAAGREGSDERPYRLVLRTVTGRSTADAAGEVLLVLNAQMDKTVKVHRVKRTLLGGFLLGSVQPRPDGSWSYSLRGLSLAPRGHPLPAGATEVAVPTKRAVALAVAKFALYPLGLLTGPPDRAAEALNARAPFRLYRAFGAFHRGCRPGGPATRALDL